MTAGRTRIVRRSAVLCLWLACCVPNVCGLRAETPDRDAFVYILNMGIRDNKIVYNGLRVGFAVGDGRMVLTAAHCVEDFENTNHSLFQPLVISPHYGEIFEAEIVETDQTNDIAILKPRWDSHPRLAIEIGDRWKKARKILIAGYRPSDLGQGGNTRVSSRVSFQEETIVETDGRGRHAIQIGSVAYPGKGWSGSAFVLPDTGSVIGVLSNERYVRRFFRNRHYIFGCNPEPIRELLTSSGSSMAAVPSPPSAGSSGDDFELILKLFDNILKDDTDNSREIVRELCRRRPDSYTRHVLAAWMLDAPGDEEYYARAIQLVADSAFTHAVYGSYLLLHARPEKSLRHFIGALAADPNHVFAHTGSVVALSRTHPRDAERRARKLTEKWPSNGGYWFELSRNLRQQGKYEQELPIIRKAVELPHPERLEHLYQRHLADSLANNKKYTEAEEAYKITLKEHPCARCWSAYTSLLIRMGEKRADDARVAFEKVKAMNEDDSVPEATIRRFETVIKRMTESGNPGRQ